MDTYTAFFLNRQVLQLKLWFEESEMEGYDSVEVWRSILDAGGPYTEMTADSWGPASYKVTTGSKKIVGKTLSLLVGVTPINITFTGTGLVTPYQMSTQIDARSAGLLRTEAGLNPGGNSTYLDLRTANVGAGVRLVVTGGDAAPIIGFSTIPPTNTHYGVEARPRLRPNVSTYTFEDPYGGSSCYYKTRLRRDSDGAVSEFSTPINGNVTRVVTPDKLVRGTVRIVDLQGRPVANRTVLISTKDTVHNAYVDGLLVDGEDQSLRTDDDGYASLLMIRGVGVTVGIAGTALARDVVPPTDPYIDSFNLFDPTVGTDDAFKVMVPEFDMAAPTVCP